MANVFLIEHEFIISLFTDKKFFIKHLLSTDKKCFLKHLLSNCLK